MKLIDRVFKHKTTTKSMIPAGLDDVKIIATFRNGAVATRAYEGKHFRWKGLESFAGTPIESYDDIVSFKVVDCPDGWEWVEAQETKAEKVKKPVVKVKTLTVPDNLAHQADVIQAILNNKPGFILYSGITRIRSLGFTIDQAEALAYVIKNPHLKFHVSKMIETFQTAAKTKD